MTRLPRALLMIGLAGSTAGSPAPAAAYVRGRADSGAPLKWMRTDCVPLLVNAAGSDDVDDGSDIVAVARAAQTWRDATAHCAYVDWVLLEPAATALPGYDERGTNDNVVYWVEQGWSHGADIVALTVMTKRTTGEIVDADIVLNGQHHTFCTGATPGARDIESTLAHELGHVLGLDHTCAINEADAVDAVDHDGEPVPPCAEAPPTAREALMYPKSAAGQTRREPGPDDVLGVCSIYPVGEDPGQCAARPGGCSCEAAPRVGEDASVPALLPMLALLLGRSRRQRRRS